MSRACRPARLLFIGAVRVLGGSPLGGGAHQSVVLEDESLGVLPTIRVGLGSGELLGGRDDDRRGRDDDRRGQRLQRGLALAQRILQVQ